MSKHAEWLREVAKESDIVGYTGWRNTCLGAAKHIDAVEAQLEVVEETHEDEVAAHQDTLRLVTALRAQLAEANAKLAVAGDLLRRFLDCPELADCDPEDKDCDTHSLERETRKYFSTFPEQAARAAEIIRCAGNWFDAETTDADQPLYDAVERYRALNEFDKERG